MFKYFQFAFIFRNIDLSSIRFLYSFQGKISIPSYDAEPKNYDFYKLESTLPEGVSTQVKAFWSTGFLSILCLKIYIITK